MSLRADFLQSRWLNYPAMPPLKIFGRVQSLSSDRQELSLRLAGSGKNVFKVSQFKLQDYVLGPVRAGEWIHLGLYEILQVGDSVALDESAKKIFLLSPQLKTTASILTSEKITLLQNWKKFNEAVSHFFTEKDFVFIETPSLVKCPGTEPTLENFKTVLGSHSGTSKSPRTFYLPTSPELHLKKAMCLGLDKVFEIRSCFRNAEFSEHHQPEFKMLEWYRTFANHENIRQDFIELLNFLSRTFSITPPEIQITTVAELFKQMLDFQLTAKTTREELFLLNQKLGEAPGADDSESDLFFRIFVGHIEPRLNPKTLFIVGDYPSYQAAYARINAQGWADRFEIYWKGLEIGNCFHEVNDPDLQAQRMQSDMAQRAKTGFQDQFDYEDFLKSLATGLPPSGGIAVGMERLFMALLDIHKISDLSLFPLSPT